MMISHNTFSHTNDGVYVDDFSYEISINANRFSDVTNYPETVDGTSAIYVHNSSKIKVFNNFIHASGIGPIKGINLQNLTEAGIHFNSILLANTDPQAKTKCLLLKENTKVTAGNNIFFTKNAGTPVYLEGGNPLLNLDRNDYFSADGTIGNYSGNSYSDLAAWRTATGLDQNSFSVNPFYTSETDLSVNQSLLNNAGLSVLGILDDIDGVLRDPAHPDLGAREFSPCANDAGINAIIAPVSPLQGGSEEVRVILQNHGTEVLTSVNINWSVNGASQAVLPWTGNMAAGENMEVVIGSFNFLAGNIYSLEVSASSPNGISDCNELNDAVIVGDLATPLCGTYTIGGPGADFNTVSGAASVLGRAGIACPVTFLIRDGVYYDLLVIEPILGSSVQNTVTFRSESGDASSVEIRLIPEALKNDPLIYLKGAQNINFKNISLYTGSNISDGNYALLLDGAKNIHIDSCYFESLNESDLGLVINGGSRDISLENSRFKCIHSRSGAIDISEAGTRDITIRGNLIQGASTWGYTILKIGNFVQNVSLVYNRIEQCYRAVYAVGADSLFILNNTIRNVNEGIYAENQCTNIDIRANRLLNISSHQNAPEGTNGIMVQRSDKVQVVNNFVETTGVGPSKGITLQYVDTCQVWYNSVNVTNTDSQGKSKGIFLKEIEQVKGRDNIFSVKALGIPMEVDANVLSLSLDYNNYYQPAGNVGKINEVLYTSLPQWGQTVNGDANSKVVNPYFKADTIPLPFQRALNGAGIAIPGVPVDIDGKTRFSQAPDIGCLEFFVDYGILNLLSPSLECFHAEPDSVIVYIRQWGDVPFNDLKVAYQMNNGPVHQDTIPGPLTEDVIHNFGLTEDLTTYGDYLFKVWLINTLDDNINNDTLYAWRYSKPSPEPSFTYDNFCTGPKVYFMGQSTVPAPYYIVSYEWLFGDGESSTVQNPVHTYAGPGTYQVAFRAYSDAGCYGEIIQEVFVNPEFIPLTLDFFVIPETCLWAGDGSIIIALSGGYPPVTLNMNGSSISASTIEGLTTGQYIFEATDSEGCVITDTVSVSSLVFMNPHIFAEPVTGNSPLTVSFDFTANNATDWLWHFSETETDTARLPIFTFFDYGSHIVRLDVMSGPPYNCTETATIEIFVDVIISIETNNVFTPNNDGVNDYFEIKTTGIKEIDASIYNVWGNRVNTIESLDGLWDGTTEGGARAPDGTYFWSLKATGADNIIYERQGSVLLLRHAAEAIPNPARDNVQVKIYDAVEPPVEIRISSSLGTLVRVETINDAAEIRTNLSDLDRGLYFIRITSAKASYFVRVVKN
jgi:gliding motility-associated-like protein